MASPSPDAGFAFEKDLEGINTTGMAKSASRPWLGDSMIAVKATRGIWSIQ